MQPHYNLEEIKELIRDGDRFITKSASIDASYIDFTHEGIYQAVLDLESSDFYKTMEAKNNSMLWHDVYHHRDEGSDITLYIKLQIKRKAVVISFKER